MTYSIRDISRLTGVQPVTLRAWERRYGLLRPARTARGHRVYDEAERRRINDIVYWVDQGVAISKVPALLGRSAEALVASDFRRGGDAFQAALQALATGNVRRVEKILSGELALYPLERVIQDHIEPLRHHLREACASPLARGHLALFESVLQQKLAVRLLNLAPGRGRTGVQVVPLGRPSRLDLVLLALAVGRHGPVWCELEETDVDAVLALALSTGASAVLFCLAPSLSGAEFKRLLGRRARQCDCAVYACCPAGSRFRGMPPGLQWFEGGVEAIARQLAETRELTS